MPLPRLCRASSRAPQVELLYLQFLGSFPFYAYLCAKPLVVCSLIAHRKISISTESFSPWFGSTSVLDAAALLSIKNRLCSLWFAWQLMQMYNGSGSQVAQSGLLQFPHLRFNLVYGLLHCKHASCRTSWNMRCVCCASRCVNSFGHSSCGWHFT